MEDKKTLLSKAPEIVAALNQECSDCSEHCAETDTCTAIYYCANRDAAALIESLGLEDKLLACGQLREQLAAVTAERGAAMKEIPHVCHTCKHKPTESKGGFGVCGMGCTVSGVSVNHYELCKWEWCGPQGAGEGG